MSKNANDNLRTDAATAAAALPSPRQSREPPRYVPIDRRVISLSALAIVIAIFSFLAAVLLTRLIGLFTNLAFYGRFSTAFVSPAGHHLGRAVVLIPVAGAVVIGFMARYGSKAIRGHGIPEAMEQVLENESRIPVRVTLLKPLSAALSIGTGGPFGAEGPIIATGGALGSLVGQLLHTTAVERKTLLAAGAAAGMAATFGSPLSALLLAVELLLFEYRARSLVPVALASVTAAALRSTFVSSAPVFAMPALQSSGLWALIGYLAVGAAVGAVSVAVTQLVYAIEDGFERLPIHWMWWPALGAVVVGVVGLFEPRTMGVGYDNIERILSGDMATAALVSLCTLKFISWSIALGSGTSGGTLAPLFTVGGGLGALLSLALIALFPAIGVDARIGALIGMAAMFAGASRAMLASVVFAFETTRHPAALLPLLGGCVTAYLVASLLRRNSIMTEKIVRRGVRVVDEYGADALARITVKQVASHALVTLRADQTVEEVQRWLASARIRHHGFPVLDEDSRLEGMITRRDLEGAQPGAPLRSLLGRPPAVIFEDSSLREAANHMAREGVGRLPVVQRARPDVAVGILTRSDLVNALRASVDEHHNVERGLAVQLKL